MQKLLLLLALLAIPHPSFAAQPNENGSGWCETYEEDCERPKQPEEEEPTRPGSDDSGEDGGGPFFEG